MPGMRTVKLKSVRGNCIFTHVELHQRGEVQLPSMYTNMPVAQQQQLWKAYGITNN